MPHQERLGLGIAGQKPGRIAAAVKPEIKGSKRPVGARIECLRPALAQVAFGTAQELAANATPPLAGSGLETMKAGPLRAFSNTRAEMAPAPTLPARPLPMR